MKTVRIRASKRKIYLAILICLVGIVLGIVIPPEVGSWIFGNVLLNQIMAILLVISCVIGLIVFVYSLFTCEHTLTITEEGIIDYSNYANVGMIKWEDIESIKRVTLMSEKFLYIYVKDPEKYFNSMPKIKRMLYKTNFKITGIHFSISSHTLKCNFSELERIIMQTYEEYKTKEK